ncbi:MAG TPA: imidazoleglycerol-phosphate dehydratase, partial [Clostridiales bacterium]|nr:imidazoleglycerol-phosphate dehydratase [Clostridiales bacterium]
MKELREAKMNRNTAETQIELELRIDGNGTSDIRTDCGFLNHML